MSDVLQRILATKREELAAEVVALSRIEHPASPPRGFARHLRAAKPGVVAEIKRASPSRGVIRADFDPAAHARDYEQAGAACLSVLTDRDYFGGAPEHLVQARQACTLPVIRKDFIIDPVQVDYARALGADAILLIVAALADTQMQELAEQAASLGMDVLVESHDEAELTRALEIKDAIIGINNRDLRRFHTELETTLRLLPLVPEGRLVVTESGISTADDVRRMREAGVGAFLIGGALMAAAQPGEALRGLLEGSV